MPVGAAAISHLTESSCCLSSAFSSGVKRAAASVIYIHKLKPFQHNSDPPQCRHQVLPLSRHHAPSAQRVCRSREVQKFVWLLDLTVVFGCATTLSPLCFEPSSAGSTVTLLAENSALPIRSEVACFCVAVGAGDTWCRARTGEGKWASLL
jgi:hypothetical protein